jgi:hypothetical protein
MLCLAAIQTAYTQAVVRGVIKFSEYPDSAAEVVVVEAVPVVEKLGMGMYWEFLVDGFDQLGLIPRYPLILVML